MTKTKNLFRFREWEVYNDAQEAYSEVLEIVRNLPLEIHRTLGNQILRSTLSIILNIAEGSGRGTDTELNRFFNIAIGSINETVAGIDALRRNNLLDEKNANSILEKLESISRQLGGFKKFIRR